MAATKVKRINVSGTVSPELDEFIENYRWSNRLTKSQVINVAMDTWAKANGFVQSANGDEGGPGEPAESPDTEGEGNDSGVTPDAPEATPEPATAPARASRRNR